MAPKKIILKKRQERAHKISGTKIKFDLPSNDKLPPIDKLPPPAIPIADLTNFPSTAKKQRVSFAPAATPLTTTGMPLSTSEIMTISTTLQKERDEIFAGISPMDITDADIEYIMSDATEIQHLLCHKPLHVDTSRSESGRSAHAKKHF
tara:strand:- start:588 stop:1034 length:447 start_codon:yes stop_codon:yes gene_type:complete